MQLELLAKHRNVNVGVVRRGPTQIVEVVAHRLVARILMHLIIAIFPIVRVKSTALFVAVVVRSPERFRHELNATACAFIGLTALSLPGLLSLLPASRFRPFKPLILIVRAIVRPCSIALILILLWLTYIIIINFHH
jgi:hypothetical protein